MILSACRGAEVTGKIKRMTRGEGVGSMLWRTGLDRGCMQVGEIIGESARESEKSICQRS